MRLAGSELNVMSVRSMGISSHVYYRYYSVSL